jgi:hypothetical protein
MIQCLAKMESAIHRLTGIDIDHYATGFVTIGLG